MRANPFHRLLVWPLPWVPRPIVWRLSRRYIAGTELEDAFAVVGDLNEQGCSATIDVLGEDSMSRGEVDTAIELYRRALTGIRERSLHCNASVKLSDMGLRFDTDLCRQTMAALVTAAGDANNFVRIDMEDSSVTSVTLDLYRQLRAGHGNVGIVIQSCLRRSADDVRALLDEGIANIRLCKGIYVEPPAIAFSDAEGIRQSYRELLTALLEGGAEKVGIATHDPALVQHAEETIQRLGVDRSRYEFQMLLGVAEPLRAGLVARGHPLRVYVPFGERWHAYSIRRLRENPRIAMHIVKNLLTPG